MELEGLQRVAGAGNSMMPASGVHRKQTAAALGIPLVPLSTTTMGQF
jgi:hypothetical protein